MLAYKRFFCILFLVSLLGGIFMIYNLKEGQLMTISIQSRLAPEREFMEVWNPDGIGNIKILLVGDADDARYGGIYSNVRQFCRDIHLAAAETEYLDMSMAADVDLVVFCHPSITRYADARELQNFIAGGGRAILAAGLAEGREDASLWGLFGICSKSSGENYHKLVFEEPLLPVCPEQLAYGGESASVKIGVGDKASVYLRDEETKVPLLYTYAFRNGSICLINGSFLADIRYMGLLTGAIGALLPDFVYPVLGVKAVFLDNFPMATSASDALSMEMYGSSVQSFILDVVWPGFQGLSLRTNTPYTSSVLAAASQMDHFPAIRDEIFTAIGKSALQFDGELVYGADCGTDGEIYVNRDFIDRFRTIFPNYTVQGLTLERDGFSPKMRQILGENLRFVRGMIDSADARLSWDENLTVFPAATTGNSMEDGNLFAICSVLGAYGMVSHVFDVNTLFAMDGEVTAWDLGKRQLGFFEAEILDRVPWLESRTLSQTESDVKSYQALSYVWKKEGSRLEFFCGGAAKGQAFFYHTDSRIVSADGLIYQDVGNGYYLLRVQEKQGSIELAEREPGK